MEKKNKRTWIILGVIMILGSIFLYLRTMQIISPEGQINSVLNTGKVLLGVEEYKIVDIMGGKGTEEPCIYGFEYQYPDKGITIGFDADKKLVRKIIFTNPGCSLYNIKTGMSVEEGGKILKDHKLVPVDNSPYRFKLKTVQVTLMSKEGKLIDGITVESFK
jgi:hypothetical protein